MKTIYYALIELIQVALGKRGSLSQLPSDEDWELLLEMAEKQAILGICFYAIQQLSNKPPEMLYLKWLGMAANVQQRNEMMNSYCVALQSILAREGFQPTILKGQGVAGLYGDTLYGYRQPGDIDVWVPDGMPKVMRWARMKYDEVKYDYVNVRIPYNKGTIVEIHWRAMFLPNLYLNWKLQRWLKEPRTNKKLIGGVMKLPSGESLVVPESDFNAIYILLHCYHHMFDRGLGLRQLMDYFFVLKRRSEPNDEIIRLFKEFGLLRFASGVMWVMRFVFGLEYEKLICEPSENEGRFLLNEVMQNGNFGQHDTRIKRIGKGKCGVLFRNLQHNGHMFSHYPSEFIWQPIWLLYHYLWKRLITYKYDLRSKC